jgi:hypothetical protein
MRLESLKKSREALDNALHDLENTRMTPPNDANLAALKEDIRRAIKKRQTPGRKSGTAPRSK